MTFHFLLRLNIVSLLIEYKTYLLKKKRIFLEKWDSGWTWRGVLACGKENTWLSILCNIWETWWESSLNQRFKDSQIFKEIFLVNVVVPLCHKNSKSCTNISIMAFSAWKEDSKSAIWVIWSYIILHLTAVALTLFNILVRTSDYQQKDTVFSSFQTQFTVEFIHAHHQ